MEREEKIGHFGDSEEDKNAMWLTEGRKYIAYKHCPWER